METGVGPRVKTCIKILDLLKADPAIIRMTIVDTDGQWLVVEQS
jgi:hypothetical protein